MAEIIFYSFAALLIIGAVFVLLANNPVKAVLSLVFCFLNATALILITGAEFVSATLIIVYVGAVVVLFLFVVMTLSTEQQNKSFKLIYTPFLALIGVTIIGAFNTFNPEILTNDKIVDPEMKNTQAIGLKLYTEYFLQFQLAGLILLVALIGVIVLSKKEKQSDIKKQDVWKQITTDPKDRIQIISKSSSKNVVTNN